MIFPDYGAYLLGAGFGDVPVSHFDMPITRLSRSDREVYTTVNNLVVDGTEYAASFDFSGPMVVALCRVNHSRDGDLILKRLAALRPGESVDLPSGWSVPSITARLGSPQDAPRELFVPLVVEEVA